MSRLAFRSALETPRPRSALLLVALASLTLVLSGQISTPVLTLQAAAMAAATFSRGSPRPWQQRASWLNAGLAFVALVALADALRGAPVAVALAEFALLASGLQLLDARPRRSEFLLVALALFQVVLASSLTDSVLFPPLLMAFLPTCVWTLLVHTLRSEALEAGDPAAASDAITPGLLGMTLAASAFSVILALGLFFLLPRMHEGLVHAGRGTDARSGFSDRVDLDDVGRIAGDSRVVLRVETLGGKAPPPERAYWRGLAFDRFDGTGWSITAPDRTDVSGDPLAGVSLAPRRTASNLEQRILREPVASGVLFGAGEAVELQGSTGRLERDANGGLYAPQTADARVRYEIAVSAASPSDEVLRKDVAEIPAGGERFLALPELSPTVSELAHRITDPVPNDLERARALETWLRRNGHYTDTPPRALPGDPRSPLVRFLEGDLHGHCEYFASAMVVMARSVGLPARLVNGFAGGRQNRVGDFVELTGSDAHAWVEVYFRAHGWVRFDPTPPDLRLAAARAEPSVFQRLAELRSALELMWFQQVVEYDRAHQVRAALGAWRTLREWLPRSDEHAARTSVQDWLARLRGMPVTPILASVGVLVLVFLLARSVRSRAPNAPLPRTYARALRLLARRGFVRAPGRTPRAFARQLAAVLSPAGAAAFAALTESYLGERYGGRGARAGEDELRALRDSLRG